jgi:hypothetical protein
VSWERLGEPSPDVLEGSRLELHYAAQLPGAIGVSLLAPQPDDAQQALSWDDEQRALVTSEVPGSGGARPYRIGLRLTDLSLFLLDPEGAQRGEKSLVGVTLDEGLRWLAGAIADYTDDKTPELMLAEHELPEHPIRAGEPFSFREPEQFEELARWFANSDRVLQRVSATNPGASPVQVWPHHFDAATLITLRAGADGDSARTVGVGMSPGDGTYDEPYLYVTPWPYPEAAELPDLDGGGRWHVEGWTGAVLIGTRIALADDQPRQVDAFLRSAIRDSLVLLGGAAS